MTIDLTQIKKLLDDNFTYTGDISIDPLTGMISCTSSVRLTTQLSLLPVSFDRVDGDFNCGGNYLTSLKGSPRHVSNSFYCHNNKLT